MVGKASVEAEKPTRSSSPDKKTKTKLPKKIHKAEREKLKRNYLNDLFSDLGLALEPSRQINGKASILDDANKILRDLIAKVESLRKENVSLLAETRYVMAEKKELKDETATLGIEVENLQNELRERMQPTPPWSSDTDRSVSQLMTSASATHQANVPPVVGSVYVIPLAPDLQSYLTQGTEQPEPSPPLVRKPHARYPTPLDSWPQLILSQQQSATCMAQHSNSGGTSISSREEDLSPPRELNLL